ncbi:hypothetical protein EV216_14311 [Rhodovulum steppense]|uniref:Uncharacterized protein n=2 Tax=Rhodovulum steppense TaxID=540251 RepID=A0A4R1YG25_9RHOB|nr:hypothetical protein EV216_14311 [Rhodovulum steppense]
MTQERQKAARGMGSDRQAEEIARSYARLFSQTDRRPWSGAAGLTAAVGFALAAGAFLLSGETPFARPDPPERRVASPPQSDSDGVEAAPPEIATPAAQAVPATPAAGLLSDPAPLIVAEQSAIAVTVRARAPTLVPPPRPERLSIAAAAPAPLRPRARPAGLAAAALEANTAPSVESPARPRLRPDDLVARAPSATASLAGAAMIHPEPSSRGADCISAMAAAIPARPRGAAPGSALARAMDGLKGAERDALIERELLKGNMPGFLRELTPVTILGRLANGRRSEVTICVTPDYLALGSDADFLRVPMGLPAAALVAGRFGFLLPTTRMVDAVHAQAGVRLVPQPMSPGSEMTSTRYFWQHNSTVQGQTRGRAGLLTAGQKKDLVLTNRLREMPGRVAIYGWHRPDGQPIQPLSTVHGARYADYSHGVRLVSQTAHVDGRAVALAALLADPAYAAMLTGEGPIEAPDRLMASLYR